MKISVISVIQNERQHIERFVTSVRKYADEIIIGVLQSVDGTEEYLDTQSDIHVVKYHKDTILAFGYSYLKNKLMSLASCDWYVFLDADEEFTFSREELEYFINIAESEGKVGLCTKTMHFPGDPNTPISSRKKQFDQNHWRICKNAAGCHWRGIVHEYLSVYEKHISNYSLVTPIEMTHYRPLHDPYESLVMHELMMRSHDIDSVKINGSNWWFRGDKYNIHRGFQKEFWKRRGIEHYPYLDEKLNRYGTHQPLLKKTIEHFKPKRIAEYGIGDYSTPYLRSLGVTLHSFEENWDWANKFYDPNFPIYNQYFNIPINYDLVFIDQGHLEHHAHQRKFVIEKFKDSIVVVHDTENYFYEYHLALSSFKYVYTDVSMRPWTTVASNHHDVTVLGNDIPFYVPVHHEFFY